MSSTQNPKLLIELLDRRFSALHESLQRLITQTSDQQLYSNHSNSIGVNVLRSAAVVEQTCGGINSNLWDDPFEWTLPEQLSTSGSISKYLDEVEATRKHCFARFQADSDLFKDIMLPSEQVAPLIGLLIETLVRASTLQGQAIAASKSFSV